MILLAILIGLLQLSAIIVVPFGIYAYLRLRRSEQAITALSGRVAAVEAATSPRGGAPVQERAGPAERPPQPAAETGAGEWRTAPAERAAPPAEAGPGLVERLERGLTAQWFVWLGALALALGSAFLVKYSIDAGWLGPLVRTSLGFALGVALVAAGEWLRRQSRARPVAGMRADLIPPALVASGVFAAFASVYAAFALYGLLNTVAAFALLAAIAFAAILLAPLHGVPVGLLGTLGAFATPALAPSADPNGWVLFSFLGVVTAATLMIAWTRRWAWLGYLVLAPASLWVMAWLAGLGDGGDLIAAGIYAVATAVLAAVTPYFSVRIGARPLAVAPRYDSSDWPNALVWCALGAASLLLFAVAAADGFALRSILLVLLFGGLALLLAWRNADFEAAPIAAASLAAAVALTFATGGGPLDLTPRRVLDPDTIRYLVTVGGLGALLAFGPYVLLAGARRPSVLAAVSAGGPVVLFAIAYARTEAFARSAPWAWASLALAALAVAAASVFPRKDDPAEDDFVLGLFAAAATAGIAFAIAVTLRQAWLTVALALEVPALAWIYLRTGARPLRLIAAAIAAVVLIRLCLNPRIAEYGSGDAVLWNWLWYGYGVPLLSFALAARAFGSRARDWLVTLLQSGAVLLATLLAALEIHLFVQGSLGAAPEGLLEASLLGISWLVLALIVARAPIGLEPEVARHGAAVLIVLAALQVVVLQLGVENPLLTGDPVGETPVLNLLLLAYGVPAALLAWTTQGRQQDAWLSHASAVLALVLAFVEVTLEVRHLYHGSVLAAGTVSDAEWYAYSAAWLVYGAVLLAGGVRFASQALRIASLVAIVAAVAKVFLFDMEALTGLYRAASFIGLGGALIGVALFYQRVVFARPSPPVSAPLPDGV